MFRLAGGKATYTYREALATLRAYMSDSTKIVPKSGFAGFFAAEHVPRFAYKTYDCVPATPGPELSDLDLLVIDGLNGRVDVTTVARLRSFGDRAASSLEQAHQQTSDFRELTWDEIGDDPETGSAGWWLKAAREHGMATPGLGVARVHKVLHHKRPHLVPLLDNQTLRLIRPAAQAAGCGQWQLIHTELRTHADEFRQLEHDALVIANTVNGVPLSWLRIHDILVWMESTGQRAPDGG